MNQLSNPQTGFLTGGGETSDLILAYPWTLTPLGPLDQWPQSLRTAVNLMLNSQQPMWIGWGPDITFLYNDAYIPVLSRAKHPWALGKPARQVWEEIWDICGPLADKVFYQAQATFVDDVQLFMNRGDFLEETYYSFSYSPIRDEEGAVAGLFCPNTEVTQKRLTTRRLNTLSDLATRALVEKTTSGTCAAMARTLEQNPLEVPFGLLYVTDGQEHLRLEQAIGLPADGHELYPARLTEEQTGPLGLSLKGVDSLQVRPLPCHPSLPSGPAGQPVTQVVLLPLRPPSESRSIGLLVLAVNPTRPLDADYLTFYRLVGNQVTTAIEQARNAEEERRRVETLAELNRAKSQFFSNVSHEFRTPLTLMLGPLEQLLAAPDPLLPADQRQLAEAAHRNALRLLKLVNTLLDFSRLEAGRLNPNREPVDPFRLTVDLASSFRSLIEEAGLQLLITGQPLQELVWLDREMWEKIVLNLLSNAFKFTLQGHISLAITEEADAFSLTVTDTGVGIPASELTRIFERFHRVTGSAGRSIEGTGIGLALVNELVTLQGGTVQVSSVVGEGSTFTVRLPKPAPLRLVNDTIIPPANVVSRPPNTQAGYWIDAYQFQEPAPLVSTPVSTQAGKARILLADDNADMRDYISRLLLPFYQVQAVADGQAALDVIQQSLPDLVLSDVMMPGLDGLQLLQALKAQPLTARIPVTLLSARAGEEATIDGYEAGADDYLVKPFSANELLARVRSQLRLSAERQRAEAQLRLIFEQAPVAICILSGPTHMVDLANERMFEIWNRSQAELLGKPLFAAIPEASDQGFEELLTQVLTTGQPVTFQERPIQLRRQGRLQTIYVTASYQPLREANGTINRVMVVTAEVTETVEARQGLEESEARYRQLATELEARVRLRTQELERSNLELMQFASVASHDLKEPLRKVQAFGSRLQELMDDRMTALERDQLRRMINAADRMQRLVGDVLELFRLSDQTQPVESVDLRAIIDQIRDDLALSIQERGAEVLISPLPTLKAAPGQMHQLFQNLISNALKYNQSPIPQVRIESIAVTDSVVAAMGLAHEQYVVIVVRDNGIGFDEKYRDRIFNLFQRLHGKNEYAGTGIGLTIVKKIVDTHRGIIQVSSQPGQGTTFRLAFPTTLE